MHPAKQCELSLRLAAFAVGLLLAGLPAAPGAAGPSPAIQDVGFPQRLSETGLYASGSVTAVRAGVIEFSPQYPLWSDAADKRRWLRLPPGAAIDASKPDTWQFPRGTRLWKEFAHAGRPVETRLIERRADARWHFASYVWSADGRDAALVPAAGVRALEVADAPGGRYAVPSRADCRTCHEGAPVPVLGFSALQLSPDRDPLAPHATPSTGTDLRTLTASGRLRGLPSALIEQPPRIAAASPAERAALGYLHGNCGHCHNDDGEPAPVPLVLAQRVAPERADGASVRRSLAHVARIRWPGAPDALRLLAPGRPQASVLALRMRSRDPRLQMPPLGTQLPDTVALDLVERWIHSDTVAHLETPK